MTQAVTARLVPATAAAIRPKPRGAAIMPSAAFRPNTRPRIASGTARVRITMTIGCWNPEPTPITSMPIATGQNPASVAIDANPTVNSTFDTTQAVSRRFPNSAPESPDPTIMPKAYADRLNPRNSGRASSRKCAGRRTDSSGATSIMMATEISIRVSSMRLLRTRRHPARGESSAAESEAVGCNGMIRIASAASAEHAAVTQATWMSGRTANSPPATAGPARNVSPNTVPRAAATLSSLTRRFRTPGRASSRAQSCRAHRTARRGCPGR